MRIFNLFKTLALTGALALTLSGCGPTEEELVSEVGKAMEAGLRADFAKFEFEERPYGIKPASTLMFEGKTSTIVAVSKPRLHGYWYQEVVMYGLAQTKNGRYFEFTYTSALHSNAQEVKLPFFEAVACTEQDCRRIHEARQLSVEHAKNWFFNNGSFTPERYKALFNEDAPPQRIAA